MEYNNLQFSYDNLTHTAEIQQDGEVLVTVTNEAVKFTPGADPQAATRAALLALCAENRRLATQNSQLAARADAQARLATHAMHRARRVMWLTDPGTTTKNNARKAVIAIASARPVRWLIERPALQKAREYWAKKLLG